MRGENSTLKTTPRAIADLTPTIGKILRSNYTDWQVVNP